MCHWVISSLCEHQKKNHLNGTRQSLHVCVVGEVLLMPSRVGNKMFELVTRVMWSIDSQKTLKNKYSRYTLMTLKA